MNAALPPRRTPDDSQGWRQIGEIVDGVVHRIGRRAISFHLSRAAASGGCNALASFREADAIRRQLGLSWEQAFTDRFKGVA